ncbi:hypothetical protein PsorP6_005608 [Peronosclerospora sorghi]|uniref:Uncharacterized protein n=1 Tax=Peronosclerospora sorghi TaxID=230839 RepID=A0ACC0W186_9STRA|nr:hypothetical protein PsorP6_005608 [Peronosclerospora sorghi]
MSRGASLSAADRLARLIQRYGLSIDKVATKLGWKIEKLRAFLAPHARRIKATTDIDDTAVEKLLMRYRLALAHQTLTQAPRTSLQPLESSARRSTLPTQGETKRLMRVCGTGWRAKFGRNVVDKRSIIRADITPTQLKASKEMEQHLPSSRKRKRRPIVLPLTTSPATIKTEALKEKTRNDKVETGSKRPYRDVRKRARSELLCPIRLDIDLDGVRFQDTFLVNAYVRAMATGSPDDVLAGDACDCNCSGRTHERATQSTWFSFSLLRNMIRCSRRDAIAESIRRQILLFTSCLRVPDSRGGRLYPIYLDLILDGFSLRDQFEWDLANDSLAAHAFACSLCADLNLPPPFEAAIVFSILEQVVAYRLATSGHQWIGTNPFQVEQGTTCSSGYMETMPRLDEIVRDTEDAQLWQPVLSELSREEVTYFTERVQATRAPTSSAKSVAAKEQPHARANRAARSTTLSKVRLRGLHLVVVGPSSSMLTTLCWRPKAGHSPSTPH